MRIMKRLLIGCFLFCALIYGCVIFLANVVLRDPTPEEKAHAEAIKAADKARSDEERCADTYRAFLISQEFIERRLKAPTTAKFPTFWDKGVGVKYDGQCTHEVGAYVDSQNSFGAMLRIPYYVKLQNEKGTNNWNALKVTVGE